MNNSVEEFIKQYLILLRHNTSLISFSDRGIFPQYWFYPYQILIYKNIRDDYAILLRRKIKGRKDTINFRSYNGLIEDSIFPNLPKGRNSMFSLTHIGNTFYNFNCNVTNNRFLTFGMGSEARFLNLRIEADAKGYPRVCELVWFINFPNKYLLSFERIQQFVNDDFWWGISEVVKDKSELIMSNKLGEETKKLFVKYLQKLRSEYKLLIDRKDLVEQQLQAFLEKHFFILSDKYPFKLGDRKIGGFNTDFTLKLSDGTILLIEIQLNNDIIIGKRGRPTSGFREGINQITDWFKGLEKNTKYDIKKCKGLIIIGRKNYYEKNSSIISKSLERKYPISLITYDDLIINLDNIIKILENTITLI